MALQWLHYQTSGVMRSVPGLVGSESECCDQVREQVESVASISMCKTLQADLSLTTYIKEES